MTPTQKAIAEIKARLEKAKGLRKEHNENVGKRQDGIKFDPRAAQAELEFLNHSWEDVAKLIRTVEIQAKEISALRDVLDAFGIDASTDLISWKEANYLAKEVEGVWNEVD